MDTEVYGSPFTGLDNLLLYLLAHLVDNLLDTGRMYAAVGNKLMQSQTGNLAANRIEARQHDCLGSVVNYDFNTGGCLQSTDIAPLTAYDTAFYLVRFNMEHSH